MLSVGQNKVKKSYYRSKSWKNEKRCKLFNEQDKNNHDIVEISKRTSKSVTTSPHRSGNGHLAKILHRSHLYNSENLKHNSHNDLHSTESISPYSTAASPTPITSPTYFSKFPCDKIESTKFSSTSTSSSIISSPWSSSAMPTNGYFFPTNPMLCNNEHCNFSTKTNFPINQSNGVDNCEIGGSTSFIQNIKSIFNRFIDNLRNKHQANVSSNYVNNVTHNSNNNNHNNNVNHNNTPDIVNNDKNRNKLSPLKVNKLQQQASAKPNGLQQTFIEQGYTSISPFTTDTICFNMTNGNCTDVKRMNGVKNCVNMSTEHRIPCNLIIYDQNHELCHKQNGMIYNTNVANNSVLTTQTQYMNIDRENVIKSKSKRKRRQPYSSVSCFTSYPNCCCHYMHALNMICHQSINRQFHSNNLNGQQYYHHNHQNHQNSNNIFDNSNQSQDHIVDNNKLPQRSHTFHTKSLSNNNNNSITFKQTANSHQHHYVQYYSPPLIYQHQHQHPHHHALPINRSMMNTTSPPFTLKHLSTIRSKYEQYEYSTKFDDKSPINNNHNHNNHNNSEITHIDNQFNVDLSLSSPLSAYHRPRFYSSNIVLLKTSSSSSPCTKKWKYITEHILLSKSINDDSQMKKRSNSWSAHHHHHQHQHYGVQQHCDKNENSNDMESDDEFNTHGTGRPSDCEFNIPFADIKLLKCLQKGERKAIYNGHWHGEVDVHIFEDLSRTERKRFWRDITRLMMTRHENIALFMGVCVDPPNFAIVTSSCKGVSLYNKLHIKREKLSHINRVYLLRQIANAITYLHSRNDPIVIRRLSSKNIFLKPKMNLYLTDYTMADCDYQLPDHVPIPLDGIKYIAPELVLTVKKEIENLCKNNCQSNLNKLEFINSAKYSYDDKSPKSNNVISNYNAKKFSLTMKEQINKTFTDYHSSKSTVFTPKCFNLIKSCCNLTRTNDFIQLPTKYTSMPNLSITEQKKTAICSDELFKIDQSIKYISSPRKVSFMKKTIRQLISSKSEQKKSMIKCVYIPVTEFTIFSDIFAYGTIIFEINARCYPYEDFDLRQCIKYLLDGQRDDGSEYCIPSSMKILMCKCWSNEPTERPSMNEITKQLIENHGLYRRKFSDPVH
ncbi:unnamed protein product [Schistosoma turkestanicum]|nr:unnamed protein product [Schistosoma turkestanicum]